MVVPAPPQPPPALARVAALVHVDHAYVAQRECYTEGRYLLCRAVIRYPGGDAEAFTITVRR